MPEARKGEAASGAAGKTKKGVRRKSKKRIVSEAIAKIEGKLSSGEVKATVGDFIRLLQLEKELEEEQPREVKVAWVEPSREGHASEE
jgi:hypothetical protein